VPTADVTRPREDEKLWASPSRMMQIAGRVGISKRGKVLISRFSVLILRISGYNRVI